MNSFIHKIDIDDNKQSVVSAQQMTVIDKIAINEFGISLLRMMERAGHLLASFCTNYVNKKGKVLILVGAGHNGGGGLVAAKYLYNFGYNVTVFLASSDHKPTTEHQLDTLKKLSVRILTSPSNFTDFDLLVDSILGYNIKDGVEEPTKSVIESVNSSNIPTVSLDLPSGLNPDTGTPEGVAVKAEATLTLAAPKVGLAKPAAKLYTGSLYLADIGIPKEVFKRI